MEEWRLGDLCIDNKGSYGIAASAVPYSEDLYTYLRITDINDDGTLNKSDLKSVADENAEQYLLQPNDIVFARTGGSTGRNYFYDGTDGVFVYAGFLIKFSIDPNKVNPKYIKYYCLSQEYKNWVYSFNTGSTRGNINAQTYSNMPIILPPRSQQDLLVKTLSSLDDKIELNNKINTNLEQQAQALFKNWFVDFEPFGGKMPEGWKVGVISDFGNVICGKTPSTKIKDYYGDEIPFITIPDMHNSVYACYTERYLSVKGSQSQESKSLPPNSICVSCIATPGLVVLTDRISQTNQQINSIIPNSSISPYYVYLTMQNLSETITMLGSSGSTTSNLNKEQFSKIKISIPDGKTMKEFDSCVQPMFGKIRSLQKENYELVTIRDTLLPKLMNEEIEV